MGKQLNLEQSDAPARRHHRGSRRFCRAPTVQVVRSRWATSASYGYKCLVLELRAERRGTMKRCGREKRLMPPNRLLITSRRVESVRHTIRAN